MTPNRVQRAFTFVRDVREKAPLGITPVTDSRAIMGLADSLVELAEAVVHKDQKAAETLASLVMEYQK